MAAASGADQGVTAGAAQPRKAVRRVPLALKLAIALVGLVGLVLLVNGAVNVWLNYGEAKSAAIRVLQEKAQGAAEQIDGFVTGIESQIGWTTRAEWARVPVEQRRYDFIRLLRQAPAITELRQIDGAGREQLRLSRLEPDAVGSGEDFSQDPRFTQAITGKAWYGPLNFRRGSEPYFTVSVAHAGKQPGVTAADVNLKLIVDVISAIRVGDRGFAYIVNAQGHLLAHPDMSLVLRDTDLSNLPQVAKALAGAGHAEPTTTGLGQGLDGTSVLSAHAGISRLGWIVFVQLPTGEALAPVYAALAQTAALLGLGILLATAVGALLARRMVGPIRRLQAGAERLGAGDLSQRISIRTGDEIETLAERFNAMAGRIQDSHETLEAKVAARTRDLGEALEQQTATADVLKVISRSAFDLQTVLDTLINSAVRVCTADQGAIHQKMDDLFHWVAQSSDGFSAEFIAFARARPFAPGTGSITARVALTGKVVHIQDVLADPDYIALGHQRLGNYRTMLGVPLLREGVPIGVFTLVREHVQAFTDRQIELVTSFADQAVIAIENVRLFEELEARTKEVTEALQQQTATADVLKVISRSAFDLQAVFDALTLSACTLCGADIGTIYVRENDVFHAKAASGADPGFLEFFKANPRRLDDRSLVPRVARSRQIEQIPDISLDQDYSFPGASILSNVRTLLGVPMLRDGKVEGVFTLGRFQQNPFTQRQIELVETFADQAGIAVENVRLLESEQTRTRELAASLENLRATQDRLLQTEKLASLGQLTAGIAHEIKNPLNFVNNFADVSSELVAELQDALAPGKAALDAETRAEIDDITGMLRANLAKVTQHGRRADSIVKNMLLHSRTGSSERRMADLNSIVDESLNLAYHGARAEKPGFSITLEKSFDPAVGQIEIFPQEFTRVLLNLISNGFYAVTKRQNEGTEPSYEPRLAVATKSVGEHVEITIRDNGNGIPDEVKAKMFNPFFTTKPAGEGTGLGLSLSFDIIKQHGGTIEVATEPGAFTQFTVTLPRGEALAARQV